MSTEDEEERPVTLVLDRSALLAYPYSIHVGEPVGEVIQERIRFGVTAVTVAEALDLMTDPKQRDHLHRLLGYDSCAVLPTWGESWQELSYWRGVTGRADLASTVMAALEHRASILTGEGTRYGPEGDLPVIYMPQ